MATKLDLTKEYKNYYTAKTTSKIVELEEAQYLSIKGKGEPAGKDFVQALDALYPFAYSVKSISKKEGRDFSVPKLEGLWWVESNRPALEVPRSEWCWKLLIRMPNFVDFQIVDKAKEEVMKKKDIELVKKIMFEKIKEGKCVQVMHIGSYVTEPETITKMKMFMDENNLTENGFHHEIYLSDPRKVAPEKMKTILRQPVKEKLSNR